MKPIRRKAALFVGARGPEVEGGKEGLSTIALLGSSPLPHTLFNCDLPVLCGQQYHFIPGLFPP